MTKFACVLLIATLVCSIQAVPVSEKEVAAAAAAGNWELVHKLLSENLEDRFKFKPLELEDVRNLKPSQGAHVFGESQYSFHSSLNVNGKTDEHSGGHKIVNNDGQVSEYDVKS